MEGSAPLDDDCHLFIPFLDNIADQMYGYLKMKKKLYLYLQVFAPFAWVPILFANPSFFLKSGRANENTLYAFYCNYSSEIVLSAIVIGIIFSIYRVFKLTGKIKYVFLFLILLSIPIQYVLYVSAHVQVFGK